MEFKLKTRTGRRKRQKEDKEMKKNKVKNEIAKRIKEERNKERWR